MTTTTITPEAPEFATFPRTVRDLITATVERGGEVRYVEPGRERLLSFWIPRRMVGGEVRMRQVGIVGWYVRDGRNKIGAGVHDVREALARH